MNGTKDFRWGFPGGPWNQSILKSKLGEGKLATRGKKVSVLWKVDKQYLVGKGGERSNEAITLIYYLSMLNDVNEKYHLTKVWHTRSVYI